MDLFFKLPDSVQRDLFHFDDDSLDKLSKQCGSNFVRTEHMENISLFGLSQLPVQSVKLNLIQNPYKFWKRQKDKTYFSKGTWKKKFPIDSFREDLDPYKAYIVEGFTSKGAYSTVWTLVAYKEQNAVIKLMDLDEYDWFEMVIHAFLYEKCKAYPNINIPRVLFLQRCKSFGTYMCMERVSGRPISSLRGVELLVALAHTMKALYQLQEDVRFMHRDLSGTNIYYEPFTHVVTFIDFGMSWLNPTKHKLAWQMPDESFYNWRTDQKMNRSLDSSILIAYSSILHPWLHELHEEMKVDYKAFIERSRNHIAKQNLSPPRKENQFTTIYTDQSWYCGNELIPWDPDTNEGDGPHWWLFNMSKFEVEDWFPEVILQRILTQIPFDHWFAIRKNWSKIFDVIAPKDLKIQLANGQTGTLQKIHKRKCIVKLTHAQNTIEVSPTDCYHINK